MSIENGARFMRRLKDDPALSARVLAAGPEGLLGVTAAAGASASAYDIVAALAREHVARDTRTTKKLVLVGLVEPKGEDFVEAFNAWYLGNHVEDTYNCPNVKSVRCLRAERGFLGKPPAQYLTMYEFEGDDADVAERILAKYQADPNAWAKREPNNSSMAIIGAGWYTEALRFGDD